MRNDALKVVTTALLTMDGKVYFDEFRPATTNDLCLRQ